MRPRVLLLSLALGALGAGRMPARADGFDWRLKAQLAFEVDTNAERKEGRAPGAVDGDTRLLLRGSLAWRFAERHALSLRVDLGGKVFFQARDEDLFISSATLGYDFRAHDRVSFDVDATIKDRHERVDETAYLNAAGGGAVRFVLASKLDLRLRAGYARFLFRADDASFGYRGDDYALTLVAYPARRVRLSASYGFARRAYDAKVFLPDPVSPGVVKLGQDTRGDDVHSAELRARVLRVVLVDASYTFQAVRSNSYGFSYLRHRVGLQLSAKLPWGVFGHLGGALQWLSFRDPVFLDPVLFVEDDNRNFVSVKLTRALAPKLSLEARWSFYASGFSGDPLYYRRHVAGLGVAYAF